MKKIKKLFKAISVFSAVFIFVMLISAVSSYADGSLDHTWTFDADDEFGYENDGTGMTLPTTDDSGTKVSSETFSSGIIIDATSGKFYNENRKGNWAQVNSGTIFKVPVSSGHTTVTVVGYSGLGLSFADSDNADEVLDTMSIAASGTAQTFEYYGTGSYILVTVTANSYIRSIQTQWQDSTTESPVSSTTAEITLNGLEETDIADAVIKMTSSDGETIYYDLESSSFSYKLTDGVTYTAEAIYGGSNAYSVSGSVTGENASAEFTVTKLDAETPQDQTTYNYAFNDGSILPPTNSITFSNASSSDGLMKISSDDSTFRYNDSQHGMAISSATMTIQVAASSTITFTGCMYSSDLCVTPSISSGTGKISTNTVNLYGFESDAADTSFSYSGDAAVLAFTFTGSGYLHAVKVVTDSTITKTDMRGNTYTIGSGDDYDYETINEALNSIETAPTSESERITFKIAAGTYREQVHLTTPYITLMPADGASDGDVIITWYYGFGYYYDSMGADGYYNSSNIDSGETYYSATANATSTWGSTFFVDADNFIAKGIVFENSFNKYIADGELDDIVGVYEGSGMPERTSDSDVTAYAYKERSNAVALRGDYAEFYNCKITSSQDTLGYNGSLSSHAYFNGCTIEGNVDYICGGGYMLFDDCALNWWGFSDTAGTGYITAAKDKTYLFRSCKIGYVDNSGGSYSFKGYLGRPWADNAATYFSKCDTQGYINELGWSDWGTDRTAAAADYGEYRLYDSTVSEDGSDSSIFVSTADVDTEFAPMYNIYQTIEETILGGRSPLYYDSEATAAFYPVYIKEGSLNSNSDKTIVYACAQLDGKNSLSEFDKIGVCFGSTYEKAVSGSYEASSSSVSEGIKITENDEVIAEISAYAAYAQLKKDSGEAFSGETVYAVPFVEADGTRYYGQSAYVVFE